MLIKNSSQNNIKKAGIYKILCLANQKFYIGSAVYLLKRLQDHKRDLRNQDHSSNYLQNAWNKYGEENFTFTILEIVNNEDELLDKEQVYLDELKPWDRKVGFNTSKFANSPMKGRHHSYESKRKISETNTGKRKLRNQNLEQISNPQTIISFAFKNPDQEIVNGSNLSKFCRLNNLDVCAMHRILSGEQLIHNGWSLPETKIKIYDIITPNGKLVQIFETQLHNFCQKRELDYDLMLRLCKNNKIGGRYQCHRGYALRDKLRFYNKFLSPAGAMYIVCKGDKFVEFAKKNNLCVPVLYRLTSCRIDAYKGWKFLGKLTLDDLCLAY